MAKFCILAGRKGNMTHTKHSFGKMGPLLPGFKDFFLKLPDLENGFYIVSKSF
jgi:hypothetical protein